MFRFGVGLPVLPGKDVRTIAAALDADSAELEESRRRAGITLERAYEQVTPMGTFGVAYLESERPFGEAMATIAQSDLAVDRAYCEALREVHGFDMAAPPPGPPPDVVGEWFDPDVNARKRGLAFIVPLLPGRTDAGRAVMKEAFVTRLAEMTASRRAVGQNAEVVTLNATPGGDAVTVYLEGGDPVEANRRFAASRSEFDSWFKQQLSTLFPPEIDFNQPLPPITQVFDYLRG